MTDLQARLKEFDLNVWNHSEDDFQLSFDARDPLSSTEQAALSALIDEVRRKGSEAALAATIRAQINSLGEGHFFLLLQLCGLTRNKIITDLKAASRSGPRRMKFPSTHLGIVASEKAWGQAGPYLVKRLQPILIKLAEYQDPASAFEAVSRATWPGFIRQERAKRQGHEAEARLARVLRRVGVPFEPGEKADNPMCRDVIISGVSFDLVVPEAGAPKVCFKATVHTSNIGQYGESKDHLEIDEAKRMLDEAHSDSAERPVLIALVDGIGFKSNRAGLEGVLSKADEFCQFQTLWKAVVVCARRQGMAISLAMPPGERENFGAFLSRWLPDPASVIEFAGTDPGAGWVMAGSAFVKV